MKQAKIVLYFKVSDDELVLFINLLVQHTHAYSSLTVIFSFQCVI